MSTDTTFDQVSARDSYVFAQEYLARNIGISIGNVLPDGRVTFRDIETGRFVYSADFWTEFRDNYTGGP